MGCVANPKLRNRSLDCLTRSNTPNCIIMRTWTQVHEAQSKVKAIKTILSYRKLFYQLCKASKVEKNSKWRTTDVGSHSEVTCSAVNAYIVWFIFQWAISWAMIATTSLTSLHCKMLFSWVYGLSITNNNSQCHSQESNSNVPLAASTQVPKGDLLQKWSTMFPWRLLDLFCIPFFQVSEVRKLYLLMHIPLKKKNYRRSANSQTCFISVSSRTMFLLKTPYI